MPRLAAQPPAQPQPLFVVYRYDKSALARKVEAVKIVSLGFEYQGSCSHFGAIPTRTKKKATSYTLGVDMSDESFVSALVPQKKPRGFGGSNFTSGKAATARSTATLLIGTRP